MKKRALITIVICTLIASVMMPFSLLADQSLPSPFVGFNVYYIDVEQDDEYETSISSTSGSYSGSVARHKASVSMTGDFTGIERTSSGVTYITTETSVGSVNGVNTQSGTITENAANESGTITLNLSSTNNFHTTENGIFEVEIILDNYYVGYFNITLKYGNVSYLTKTIYVNGNSCKFTYAELGAIGSNTTLNNYTITINSFNLSCSLYKSWSFPVESYSIIYSAFNNNLNQVGIDKYNDYLFPIFLVDQNNVVNGSRYNNGQSFYWIFMLDKTINSVSSFQNYFDVGYLTVDEILLLNRFLLGNQYVSLVRVKLTNNTGTAQNFLYTYKYANSSKYMPIFNDNIAYKYVSTDFALQFGLTNNLLDNTQLMTKYLNIMANGTSSSNNKVSEFNQESNEMNQTISDYNTIENQFNDDFNDNMNAITPSDNGLDLMGSRFLNSANWVKTQFDRMTNNTPFGSVLGFSLVLGLGLLIIGRVLG